MPILQLHQTKMGIHSAHVYFHSFPLITNLLDISVNFFKYLNDKKNDLANSTYAFILFFSLNFSYTGFALIKPVDKMGLQFNQKFLEPPCHVRHPIEWRNFWKKHTTGIARTLWVGVALTLFSSRFTNKRCTYSLTTSKFSNIAYQRMNASLPQ